MAKLSLTPLDYLRLGLRWYGLVFSVVIIGVAVAAWVSTMVATWDDREWGSKVWLTVLTVAVIGVFSGFFRLVNRSRRQLMARAEERNGDADPA